MRRLKQLMTLSIGLLLLATTLFFNVTVYKALNHNNTSIINVVPQSENVAVCDVQLHSEAINSAIVDVEADAPQSNDTIHVIACVYNRNNTKENSKHE